MRAWAAVAALIHVIARLAVGGGAIGDSAGRVDNENSAEASFMYYPHSLIGSATSDIKELSFRPKFCVCIDTGANAIARKSFDRPLCMSVLRIWETGCWENFSYDIEPRQVSFAHVHQTERKPLHIATDRYGDEPIIYPHFDLSGWSEAEISFKHFVFNWRISLNPYGFNFTIEEPRPLRGLHLSQLPTHKLRLLMSIMTRYVYSGDADEGGEPKTDNFRVLPKPVPLPLGCILIGLAVELFAQTFNRVDYFFYISIFGGFVPFAFGCAFILFCFLSNPPPIFGFVVGHDGSPP